MKKLRFILPIILIAIVLAILVLPVQTIYAGTNHYWVGGIGTISNNVGTITASPTLLVVGANVITVTGLGTLNINISGGLTGNAASGALAIIVGSPVTLTPAGITTITVGGALGTITITLTQTTVSNWSSIYSWSTSSGGVSGAAVPTSADNVFFDMNSFSAASQTATIDTVASCLSMDWTGAGNTPTLAGGSGIYCYGNIKFIAGMVVTSTSSLYFRNSSAMTITAPITLGGMSFFVYDGAGSVTLLSNLITNQGTNTTFNYSSKNLITNDFTISVSTFTTSGAGAKTFTPGNSIINCTAWSWTATNTTLAANTSIINVRGTGAFAGGGITTYNIVNLIGSAHTISGSNTFAQLNGLSSATQTITFTDGTTQTVGTAALSGSAGHVHTLQGTSTGGWNIAKTGGGTVVSTYLSISYSTGTPTNTWYAASGNDNGHNTNWYFGVPSAPTGFTASDGTDTSQVVTNWTKSSGATGYIVYRGAVNDSGTLGDVATYNDTNAAAPTITQGTTSASNGTSQTFVTISVAGQHTNVGATEVYKVVAVSPNGNSADSNTDNGNRGVGTLTLQGQMSAADSDASYSDVVGATTNPYNVTTAPFDGSKRYFRHRLNATGASEVTSTAGEGWVLFILGAPTGFTSTTIGNNIVLNWVTATNATATVIIRGDSAYPTSITDGTVTYNGSGTTYTDLNMNSDTAQHYYSAFSYYAPTVVYSSTYATAVNGGKGMILLAILILPLGVTGLAYGFRKSFLKFLAIITWWMLGLYLYFTFTSLTNVPQWVYLMIPFLVSVGLGFDILHRESQKTTPEGVGDDEDGLDDEDREYQREQTRYNNQSNVYRSKKKRRINY